MNLNLVQQDRIEVQIDIYYKNMTPCLKRIISTIREEEPHLTGKDEDRTVYISLNDIYYFETVDRRTFVYLEKAIYRLEMTLGQIIDNFAQCGFIRTSKSQIVNIYKVTSIKPTIGMRVIAILENKEKLIINRTYRDNFEESMINLRRRRYEKMDL